MKTCQLAIIGGGPAGLAAACAAYDASWSATASWAAF